MRVTQKIYYIRATRPVKGQEEHLFDTATSDKDSLVEAGNTLLAAARSGGVDIDNDLFLSLMSLTVEYEGPVL